MDGMITDSTSITSYEDFQLTKVFLVLLQSKGIRINQDALKQLTSRAIEYFHQLSNHLQNYTELQRRRKPIYDDVDLLFRLHKIEVHDMYCESLLSKRIHQNNSRQLKLINTPQDPELEEYSEESLPFFHNQQYNISELVHSQVGRPDYIPAYLPDLPPDYTYQSTPNFVDTITDLKTLRVNLVNQSRATEISLYELIDDENRKWRAKFEEELEELDELSAVEDIMSDYEVESPLDKDLHKSANDDEKVDEDNKEGDKNDDNGVALDSNGKLEDVEMLIEGESKTIESLPVNNLVDGADQNIGEIAENVDYKTAQNTGVSTAENSGVNSTVNQIIVDNGLVMRDDDISQAKANDDEEIKESNASIIQQIKVDNDVDMKHDNDDEKFDLVGTEKPNNESIKIPEISEVVETTLPEPSQISQGAESELKVDVSFQTDETTQKEEALIEKSNEKEVEDEKKLVDNDPSTQNEYNISTTLNETNLAPQSAIETVCEIKSDLTIIGKDSVDQNVEHLIPSDVNELQLDSQVSIGVVESKEDGTDNSILVSTDKASNLKLAAGIVNKPVEPEAGNNIDITDKPEEKLVAQIVNTINPSEEPEIAQNTVPAELVAPSDTPLIHDMKDKTDSNFSSNGYYENEIEDDFPARPVDKSKSFDFVAYAKLRRSIQDQKVEELKLKRIKRLKNIFLQAEKYFSPYCSKEVTEKVEESFNSILDRSFKKCIKAIRVEEEYKKSRLQKILEKKQMEEKEAELERQKSEFVFGFNPNNDFSSDSEDEFPDIDFKKDAEEAKSQENGHLDEQGDDKDDGLAFPTFEDADMEDVDDLGIELENIMEEQQDRIEVPGIPALDLGSDSDEDNGI